MLDHKNLEQLIKNVIFVVIVKLINNNQIKQNHGYKNQIQIKNKIKIKIKT